MPTPTSVWGTPWRPKGKLDEAAKEYSISLALKPDDPQAHNMLGNVRTQQGKLDEAVAQYREALRLDPENPETHLALGYLGQTGTRQRSGGGGFARVKAAARLPGGPPVVGGFADRPVRDPCQTIIALLGQDVKLVAVAGNHNVRGQVDVAAAVKRPRHYGRPCSLGQPHVAALQQRIGSVRHPACRRDV